MEVEEPENEGFQKVLEAVKDDMDVEEEDWARDIATQIASIDKDYEDTINAWDAYAMKHDVEPTKEDWSHFFKPWAKKWGKKKFVKPKPKPKPKTPVIQPAKELPKKKSTPIFKRPKNVEPIPAPKPILPQPTSSILDWDDRKNAGETVATLNDQLPESSSTDRGNLPELQIEMALQNDDQWLWEKIEEVSSNAKRRVEQMGEIFRMERMMSGDMEVQDGEDFFEPITTPCQNESYFLGRIWNTHEGVKRLNQNSVCLESAVVENEKEIPACVRLNISEVQGFMIFPGQIVVVRGTNPSGDQILAQEIFCDFPLSALRDISDPDIPILSEEVSRNNRQGLGLLVEVACGPFTCQDYIGWEQSKPMHSFLEEAKKSRPDALVLCGPFIDRKSNALEHCTRDYLSEFIHFLRCLRGHLEKNDMLSTSIIFVPSVRDAFHQPNFPQWAYDESYFFHNPKFTFNQFGDLPWHFSPNPSTFTINHISFGVTTMDGLMHLNQQQITKVKEGAPKNSRLHSVARAFIEQQSFYPLFPEHQDAFVDWTNTHCFQMKWTPDILISPSQLKPFATKLSEDCIFVNSGYLAKAKSGGTFTKIHVPFTDASRLQDKIRIDVIRI